MSASRAVSLLAATAALLAFPPEALGQRLGAHPWGPWGPTLWDVLKVRVKCEGYTPFTGITPTHWRVDIRNVGKEPVYLSYDLSWRGNPRPPVPGRRLSIQPGKSAGGSADLDTECSAEVITRISLVRVGRDVEDQPYLPPDHPMPANSN